MHETNNIRLDLVKNNEMEQQDKEEETVKITFMKMKARTEEETLI